MVRLPPCRTENRTHVAGTSNWLIPTTDASSHACMPRALMHLDGGNVTNKLSVALACAATLFSTSLVQAYEVDRAHHRIVLSAVEEFDPCQHDFADSASCVDALSRYVRTNPKAGNACAVLAKQHAAPMQCPQPKFNR